jgi:uncharacterized protein YndB with AHSA1/START domain
MTHADDRSVELEIEVPGTPEEVWDAIATGPGLSVWFVPAEIEERAGGAITMHHGEGMDDEGTVTAYDRPRRFAFESAPFSPREGVEPRVTALELLVEARSGGTCVVRLINSGFGPGPEWDDQVESTHEGWRRCLRVLALYLTHFAGQRGTPFVAFGALPASRERAWAELLEAVGADPSAERTAVRADGAPTLAGTVDEAHGTVMTLLLDEPAPGIGYITAGGPGDPSYVVVAATLFGDAGAAAAAEAAPAWRALVAERFPLQRSGGYSG